MQPAAKEVPSPAPWLQFVLVNPHPRLPLGALLAAKGGIVGEVTGYAKPGRFEGYVVDDFTSGAPRIVFQSEIVEQLPGPKPKLRVVA